MKIAFITIHIGINVGSNLQAIATSEVLKKAGHDPILINYIPDRVTYKRFWSNAKQSPKNFMIGVFDFMRFHFLKKKFATFQKKYCQITHPIYSHDNFAKALTDADIYLTGSDQVWNFKHNEGYDGHYFFDGIEGRKVAYASSIGMDTLTETESLQLRQALSQYEKISVREDKAVSLLKEIDIESVQLMDPTLMLNREQWSKFITKQIIKEPYMLVYLPYNISDIEEIYKTVRKIARRKSIKVVTFSWTYRPIKYADKTIYYASPGDFLSLMYYADYVVTNSFHGTAFSINLNKQFWVYAPSKYSSRVGSIIRLLGLDNRLIDEEIDDKSVDNIIDYSLVNQLLDKERERAMEFLKSL